MNRSRGAHKDTPNNFNKRVANRFECRRPADDKNLVRFNQQIISNNLTRLLVDLETSTLEDLGTRKPVPAEAHRPDRYIYGGRAYVDWRTGEVLGVGKQDEVALEIVHGEFAIELEIEVSIDDIEPEEADYSTMQYALRVPAEPDGGAEVALETRLTDQAIQNIETTLSYCNDPDF